MKVIEILFVCLLVSLNVQGQPYEKAPESKKKIREIIEWIRPNLKAKSSQGMISTFNKKGHLMTYTSSDDSSIMNTYHLLDPQGRVLETREGKGTDLFLTRNTYKKDRTIKVTSFRGKDNRIISFLDKKGKIVEQKTYVRGLEIGKQYQLKERIIYQYNKKNQLTAEEVRTYKLPKSKSYAARKKTYHYHPDYRFLIKTVEYDYDKSVSVVEDYAYYPDRKLKSIISNFIKDDLVSTKEFLYKDGALWQRIAMERGIRHVEVFTGGRLIRLRSYNNDQIYRVVDYQYAYY